MQKTLKNWFFMRDGFDTFRFEPEKHSKYIFGDRERNQRDFLMGGIEESSYSSDGQKAVVFGDYGRGKTHLCHNLEHSIKAGDLQVMPVYVKCSAFKSREPFSTFFLQLLLSHPVREIQRVADGYAKKVQAGEALPLDQVIRSDAIANVMSAGLAAPNPDAVSNSLRWLGGEAKVQMGLIASGLKPQLTDSRDFGEVMRGIAHMFIQVDGKTPLYLVDEAERLEGITNPDVYVTWLASLREITEILNVGIIFFIGANTRNNLPALLLHDEIQRRIGFSNYIEFMNGGREDLRAFVVEVIGTAIRKGAVPSSQHDVVEPGALDEQVPADLQEIVGGEQARLAAFPFEPDALQEFLEQVTADGNASKPSEMLMRLQKAAQRAMKLDRRTIGLDIVEAIANEGL